MNSKHAGHNIKWLRLIVGRYPELICVLKLGTGDEGCEGGGSVTKILLNECGQYKDDKAMHETCREVR